MISLLRKFCFLLLIIIFGVLYLVKILENRILVIFFEFCDFKGKVLGNLLNELIINNMYLYFLFEVVSGLRMFM